MKGDEPAIVGSCALSDGGGVTAGSHVAILLGTCNGERHLQAQLASLQSQTHGNWSLWVSDDGSTDATPSILTAFAAQCSQAVHVLAGPRQGFAANYLSLVQHPPVDADGIAFCDQDDVWLPDHLEKAVEALAGLASPAPALYCGRTLYIDAEGQAIGASRPAPSACNFPLALAQNVCAGNTMVLNRAAHTLLRQVPPDTASAHDWLAYLVVTAVGGTVVFDPAPTVQYRQHRGNAMGENQSLRAKWHRIRRLLAGDLRAWTQSNLAALAHIESHMTPVNQRVLREYKAARTGAAWTRIARLRQSGVRRESIGGHFAFQLALVLGLV